MNNQRMTVLVVGATGSIGRLVVPEAVRKGHAVRALARDPDKARRLFPDVEVVVGDLTRPDTLTAAVDRVDAIVFTHGSNGGGKAEAERVDYGGVRSVFVALGGRSVRIRSPSSRTRRWRRRPRRNCSSSRSSSSIR